MTDLDGWEQWQNMSTARAPRPPPEGTSPPLDFETLFRRELAYVWFTLRRLGVLTHDLEDVTHDVFVLVYRHLDRYDATRPIRPWLFGFAYRVACGYRRLARHRMSAVGDLTDVEDHSASVDDELAVRESLDLALRALDELDLDRRAVFVLHDIEGCSMPEVANALQIPLNTAYSRLRVARVQFAKTWKRIRGNHE